MTRRTVKVFHGYPFNAKGRAQSTSHLKAAVERSMTACETDWNAIHPSQQVQFERTDLDISQGDLLPTILERIAACDIGLFNVSDDNVNVAFELGFAEGLAKPTIWACHNDRLFQGMPADFRGRFMLFYTSTTNLEQVLPAELMRRVEALLDLTTPAGAFHALWNLDDYTAAGRGAQASIIAASLPRRELSPYASTKHPNHLKYARFADIDTVVELKMFLQARFKLPTVDLTSDKVDRETLTPTFYVGAPTWNKAALPYYGGDGQSGRRVPASFRSGSGDKDDILVWNGREYQPRPSKGLNFRDVGLFARLTTSNKGLPVFLVAGCRTYGVLGAAKALTSDLQGPNNALALRETMKLGHEFAALFWVEVQNGVVQVPDLTDRNVLVDVVELNHPK